MTDEKLARYQGNTRMLSSTIFLDSSHRGGKLAHDPRGHGPLYAPTKDHKMPRQRSRPRPRPIHISLPEDVIAEVDEKLYDPAKGKTLYGGYSLLVTSLLRKWLEDPSILPIELVEEPLE